MSEVKPVITCHVLDIVNGRPAAGIAVTLQSDQLTAYSGRADFKVSGVTDSDGRVTAWTGLDENGASFTAHAILDEFLDATSQHDDVGSRKATWTLKFEPGDYFGAGVETFWDDIVIRFKTSCARPPEGNKSRHWHVPLLLSPWSYTTYRGS